MAKTAMPSTIIHALCEKARHSMPAPPISIPATMVGSAGRSRTTRLTSTWSRMIMPASMTVMCSASKTKFTRSPTAWSNPVTAWLTGARSTKSRRYQSTEPNCWK